MKSFGGIAEFIAVVELKSFVVAGEHLGISSSGVSKAIGRLEARLGARLLYRTTRSLRLTKDGAAFYQRCNQLMVGLEEAEQEISRTHIDPRGRLTVELPRAIGRLYVMPALSEFARRYPQLSVHAVFRDQYEELLQEEMDVAVRLAGAGQPRQVSRVIGPTRYVTCAAPGYLEAHGMPVKPNDLLHHNCLGYLSSQTGRPREWHFSQKGTPFSVSVNGNLAMSNSEGLIEAAVAGLGIVQLLDLVALQAVQSGQLRPILSEWVAETRDLCIVYSANKQSQPKIKLFESFVIRVFAGAIDVASSLFASGAVQKPRR